MLLTIAHAPEKVKQKGAAAAFIREAAAVLEDIV